MSGKKKVIVIAGATAVGKTSVAIEVAKHFKSQIISADSRQCYKEMNIGVARPSVEQLQQVEHHFVASHSIHEKVTAATFEKYALEKASAIFLENDIAVMVGGTGLYIKAFCDGFDEIPDVPEEVRNEIIKRYELEGLEWLKQNVEQKDPLFFATGEINNPQRLMRALEVITFTGSSIVELRKRKKAQREFETVKIALNLPKEQLHHNINSRVETMVQQGLEQEARTLLPYRHLNALQTVGYKEMFQFFDGHVSLKEGTDLIKKNTRQYAKRQLTWFRKDKEYRWLPPAADEVISFAEKNL